MADPDVGDPAPDFALPDADGEIVRLDELLERPLILYFYPADFTPGCTKQACDFRDSHDEFEREGARVVGISRDPPGKHAKFRLRYDLQFPLLSDEDGSVHEAYGATGILGRRSTFVIAPDGRIVARIASPIPGGHIRKALARLKEIVA